MAPVAPGAPCCEPPCPGLPGGPASPGSPAGLAGPWLPPHAAAAAQTPTITNGPILTHRRSIDAPLGPERTRRATYSEPSDAHKAHPHDFESLTTWRSLDGGRRPRLGSPLRLLAASQTPTFPAWERIATYCSPRHPRESSRPAISSCPKGQFRLRKTAKCL